MRICPKCGRKNSNNSQYCVDCGETLIKKGTNTRKGKPELWIFAVIGAALLGVGVAFVLNWLPHTDNPVSEESSSVSETDSGKDATDTQQTESELSYEETDTQEKELVDTITAQTSVGDSVYFGTYEQDNDLEDGNEWIQWLVLDEEDDCYVLITSEVIDCVCYNNEWKATAWENCSLRNWLNTTFLTNAFTKEQVESIADSYHTDKDGNTIEDQIFILNSDELRDYFDTNEARAAGATPYATAQGVYVYSNGRCWWWISEAGADPHYARYVNCEGVILEHGMLVFNNAFGVRPVIRVYK